MYICSDSCIEDVHTYIPLFSIYVLPLRAGTFESRLRKGNMVLTCLDCVWTYGSHPRFPLSFLKRLCAKSIRHASVPWSTLIVSQIPSCRRISLQTIILKILITELQVTAKNFLLETCGNLRLRLATACVHLRWLAFFLAKRLNWKKKKEWRVRREDCRSIVTLGHYLRWKITTRSLTKSWTQKSPR